MWNRYKLIGISVNIPVCQLVEVTNYSFQQTTIKNGKSKFRSEKLEKLFFFSNFRFLQKVLLVSFS